MAVQNPWLDSLQRSFNEIKARILSRMETNCPEITDKSEGNIFVIIVSIFSAIAEVLHYYIDNMARETFFVTARRFDSLYKHCKLVDYHIKSGVAASIDIWVQYNGDNGPIIPPVPISISHGTQLKANDGSVWQVAKDLSWGNSGFIQGNVTGANTEFYLLKIPLTQVSGHHIVIASGDGSNLNGVTTITNVTQRFVVSNIPDGEFYLEGSMVLSINGEQWELVDSFAYSNSTSKHFSVITLQDGSLAIVFGNGEYGSFPPLGGVVVASCMLTKGAAGNGLTMADFSSLSGLFNNDILPNISLLSSTTSSGGSDKENFDQIQEHLPLAVRTIGMAVTKEDYEDIAKLIPGVNKAYVKYNCGKNINIYITPDNANVVASEALILSANRYMSKVKSISSAVTIEAAPMAHIVLYADITGKKSFKASDINNQIIKALVDAYSYYNSDVNKTIRLSDIYSLIDNLSMVDYLSITFLWVYTDAESYVINQDFIGLPSPFSMDNVQLIWPDDIEFDKYGFSISVTKDEESGEDKITVYSFGPFRKILTVIEDEESGEDIFPIGTDSYDVEYINIYHIIIKPKIKNGTPIINIPFIEFDVNKSITIGATYTQIIHKPNIDQVPDNYGMPTIEPSNIKLTINEVI